MKTTLFMLVISVVVAVSLAPASAQKPATPHVALRPADVTWGGYPGGLPVTKGEPLFPRIT